jgi:hypothetical protein
MSEAIETRRLLYNGLLAEKNEEYTSFYALRSTLVERKVMNKYLSAVDAESSWHEAQWLRPWVVHE